MKEMDSEDKFWLCVWAIIGITVIAVVGMASLCYIDSTKKFVEGGYHECAMPGLQGGRWCK